jgi:hypothetical protein
MKDPAAICHFQRALIRGSTGQSDGWVRLKRGSPGPDQRLLFLGYLDLGLIHGALEYSTNSKRSSRFRASMAD